MISKLATSQVFGAPAADAAQAQPNQDRTQSSGPGQQPSATEQKAPSAAPAPQPEPLLRLEIGLDRHGGFVYTLTDRDTGRVVAQIPREAVEQLSSDPNYTAGTVVATKA